MSFNPKGPSKTIIMDKVILKDIRLITPDDHPILLSIKEDYDLIDQDSNIYEKAACTLICSILIQERLYFGLTFRAMQSLMLRDPNLGQNYTPIHSRQWASLLASFYNQFNIIELLQKGSRWNSAAYRMKHPEIAKYLLGKGIDGAKQKVETLRLCSRVVKNQND